MRVQDSLGVSPYLTTKETAQRLKVSTRLLENLRVRGGGPPFIVIGRVIRYHVATTDAWAAAHARKSTSDSRDVLRRGEES